MKIEFYVGEAAGHIAVVKDTAPPREGEFINIRKVTYRVVRVTWAVDHADDWSQTQLRANVVLEPA